MVLSFFCKNRKLSSNFDSIHNMISTCLIHPNFKRPLGGFMTRKNLSATEFHTTPDSDNETSLD